MSLTLDGAEAALFACLEGLGPSPGNATARLVARYTGQLTPEGIDAETLARSPAVLLAVEGEDPVDALTQETLLGEAIDQGRIAFRVYTVTRETRDTTKAIKGATNTLGSLALVNTVIAQLNRLTISSASYTGQVRYLGFRPALIRSGGAYAYMVRFALVRHVPGTDAEAEVVAETDLERVDTSINIPDGTGDTNPVVQTRTDL